MPKRKEKEFPGGVKVVDYGEPEYLDGAMMQFAVHGKDAMALGYFTFKADAELFARTRAAGLRC